MVHVTNELSVLFRQGVERAVGHGDDTSRHAWLIAVTGEQAGQTLDQRPARVAGYRLIRRGAKLAGDVVAMRPSDVGENALDATATLACSLDRSGEELGSEVVVALGHADGDLSCHPAVPLGRSTRTRTASPRRAAVANLEGPAPTSLSRWNAATERATPRATATPSRLASSRSDATYA
jgi:hypothetical protein